MATRKKNVKDHDARKSQGGNQKYKDANKARNAARGPQELVTVITHNADGTDTVKHSYVRN